MKRIETALWRGLELASFSSGLFRRAILIVVGTSTALTLITGVYVTYLTITPMSWWVDYQEIWVEGNGPEAMVLWRRTVEGKYPVPVRIYAELHNYVQNAVHDQYCEGSSLITAEPETSHIVKQPLRDVLRTSCRFMEIPCKPMELQLIISLELDYGIRKTKRFISGPFYPSGICPPSELFLPESMLLQMPVREWAQAESFR